MAGQPEFLSTERTHALGKLVLTEACNQANEGLDPVALEQEINLVLHNLVSANLFGHDSHGVFARAGQYARMVLRQFIVPCRDEVRIDDKERPGEIGNSIWVTTGNNFGQVGCTRALEIAKTKLRESAFTDLTVHFNANHIGCVQVFGRDLARDRLMSKFFVEVIGKIGAPFGSALGITGSNPYCHVVPYGDDDAFVLDFATTYTAEGKVRVAAFAKQEYPTDVLFTPAGEMTTDPVAFYGGDMQKIREIGAIAMFGQHKGSGFALGLAIDGGIFADGSLTDADQLGGRNAVRLHLTDLKALEPRISREKHDAMMSDFVERIRSMPPLNPQTPVMAPGDPEIQAYQERTQNGIPLRDGSLEDIRHMAERMNIREKVEEIVGR